MDATRAWLSLSLRRLLVLTGLLLGGWLLGASTAAAEDRPLAELAQELLDQAKAGTDIGALVSDAVHGVVPTAQPEREPTAKPEREPAAKPEPEPVESTSSAHGSTDSTPNVEVVQTYTYGGIDYGPDPGSGSGSESNFIDQAAGSVENFVPEPAAPPQSGTPPPTAKPAVAPARTHAPVVPHLAPTFVPAPPVSSDSSARTAPAERPADPPAPSTPAAPGSGSSAAGAAHDGGGQARGTSGVLSTRDRAAAPTGGWSVAVPQVLGAAGRAAGSPTSTPD